MTVVLTVVGARPQFVKAAPVSRAMERAGHREIIVHTGQHYDNNMSAVFFEELGLPPPAHHLGVGSGSHGAATGAMLAAIERVLIAEKPDRVLVYGDTNSTLAGALAAAKLHIPVAHVEAGLRSYDRSMPEEVNRVMTDHLSDLLLVPSEPAVQNLAAEGLRQGVHVVGDVMADALALALERRPDPSTTLRGLGLSAGAYILATIHRQENADSPERLKRIMAALGALGEPVVFPVHPRTRKALAALGMDARPGLASADRGATPANVTFIDPVGFLEMVHLESSSRVIVTDSGGVQKEAYWLHRPCVTVRDTTEWGETVQTGWNTMVGTATESIISAVRDAKSPANHPPLYGDAHAADRVVALL